MKNVKTGQDIVNLHKEYVDKINEIDAALSKLDEFDYTKKVLKEEHAKLTADLRTLETTRFQPMEPVIITTSLLGGRS